MILHTSGLAPACCLVCSFYWCCCSCWFAYVCRPRSGPCTLCGQQSQQLSHHACSCATHSALPGLNSQHAPTGPHPFLQRSGKALCCLVLFGFDRVLPWQGAGHALLKAVASAKRVNSTAHLRLLQQHQILHMVVSQVRQVSQDGIIYTCWGFQKHLCALWYNTGQKGPSSCGTGQELVEPWGYRFNQHDNCNRGSAAGIQGNGDKFSGCG